MSDHQTDPTEPGGELVRQPHGGALRPFTAGDPRAAAGRAKGLATLREQRALKSARVGDVKSLLSDLVAACPRDHLGPVAAAVAQDLIARVVTGEIIVRHAGDAADLLRVLVDVARLEAPLPTSATIMAHSSDPEVVMERIRVLRSQA